MCLHFWLCALLKTMQTICYCLSQTSGNVVYVLEIKTTERKMEMVGGGEALAISILVTSYRQRPTITLTPLGASESEVLTSRLYFSTLSNSHPPAVRL